MKVLFKILLKKNKKNESIDFCLGTQKVKRDIIFAASLYL
jgi:hypothetical protein